MLLDAGEPRPPAVFNPGGRSSFLLIVDHAGARVPKLLGELGLSAEDRSRHIALDLGAAELGMALARRLDAACIAQPYSRLVIDCNRHPDRPDAIPVISDGSAIPGNAGLSTEQRQARMAAIHAPYHAAIAGELARRDAAGEMTVVVALHSFTPQLMTAPDAGRRWHAGVLYGGGDERFAVRTLAELRRRLDAPVGDNEPYAMDGIDYTIPFHCFAAGRRYVEFEIRQDLLTQAGAAGHWADLLADVLGSALA